MIEAVKGTTRVLNGANAEFIGIGRALTHIHLCRAAPRIVPRDGLSFPPGWGRFFWGIAALTLGANPGTTAIAAASAIVVL